MRIKLGVSAVLALCLLPVVAAAQQTDARPGLAVFPFTNGGAYGPDKEDLAPLEVGIQQMILTELAQNPNLRVVERSELRRILEEQDLVRAGRVDPGTAAQVGRLVGARYVVTGSFIDLFGNFRLDARIIDVETSELVNAVELRSRREDLYQLLVDMAARVVEGVSLPPLEVAMVAQRRSRAIPAEAVTLFSRAQVYQDGGRNEQAIELYRQIAQRFPQMTEAREALQQLTGGA
jgi:TolB-like protein